MLYKTPPESAITIMSIQTNYQPNKSPSLSLTDGEKLASYMVANGMLDGDLAKRALSFSEAEEIPFDEALLIIDKQISENKDITSTSTKSHISGQEAKLLRRLIENDLISSDMAAEITRDSLNLKLSALNILTKTRKLVEKKQFEDEAQELLLKAGVVETEDQYHSKNWQLESSFRPLVVQILKGNLTARLEKAALNCAELVDNEEMSRQEALIILRHMQEKNRSFEETLKELGFRFGPQVDQTEVESIREKLNSKLHHCIKKLNIKPIFQA